MTIHTVEKLVERGKALKQNCQYCTLRISDHVSRCVKCLSNLDRPGDPGSSLPLYYFSRESTVNPVSAFDYLLSVHDATFPPLLVTKESCRSASPVVSVPPSCSLHPHLQLRLTVIPPRRRSELLTPTLLQSKLRKS